VSILFLACFTLSLNEAEAFSSPEIPVSFEFFAAMDRAQAIRDDCCTDLPRIEKAGDVYRKLHDAKVPNIPALGPTGDVLLSPDHANTSPLAVQRTKTQDYVKGSGRGEWCPGRPCVEPYVHYRLVLETLGQPLNTFKSTRQLCDDSGCYCR